VSSAVFQLWLEGEYIKSLFTELNAASLKKEIEQTPADATGSTWPANYKYTEIELKC
jgi:hypothetical protein